MTDGPSEKSDDTETQVHSVEPDENDVIWCRPVWINSEQDIMLAAQQTGALALFHSLLVVTALVSVSQIFYVFEENVIYFLIIQMGY